MSEPRTIAINGDLGSGKSTVAAGLAVRLGLRRVSMGDIYRQLADERGMTALQLNRHSERDRGIDGYVDRIQREMADSGEAMIVDSRLGWHFFANAFKLHLVTDPMVAARRVVGRPADDVESYESVDEARQRLHERSASERHRFIERYGVDKARLRNYDLVCDTTRADPDDIVTRVIGALDTPGDGPRLLLDPRRVYPTERIQQLRGLWDPDGIAFVREVAEDGGASLDPIHVGFDGTHFFVIDGHRRLSAAIQAGLTLVRAELAAEFDELYIGGLSADRYFTESVELSSVYDWEAAHRTELPLPPHLRQALAR